MSEYSDANSIYYPVDTNESTNGRASALTQHTLNDFLQQASEEKALQASEDAKLMEMAQKLGEIQRRLDIIEERMDAEKSGGKSRRKYKRKSRKTKRRKNTRK